MRRARRGEQMLRDAEVRLAHRADPAVGIGQSRRPFDRVVAILPLPDERVVLIAVGSEAAAYVLHDDHIAALDEVIDIAGACAQVLVVGQAREQDRKTSVSIRTINIGAQRETVAGLRRHVFFDDHAISRFALLSQIDYLRCARTPATMTIAGVRWSCRLDSIRPADSPATTQYSSGPRRPPAALLSASDRANRRTAPPRQSQRVRVWRRSQTLSAADHEQNRSG